MNNNNNWLTYVKTHSVQSGIIITNESITIEWKISDILSKSLAQFKSDVADLAATVTAASETEFLRKFPDAVSKEHFLKSCAPFFDNGVANVNWTLVEETIEKTIKQFYLTDISSFGPQVLQMLQNDLYIFASAKDANGKLIGFIMLAITPALAFGELKMINLVVEKSQDGLIVEKKLLETILSILPATKLIFTAQRVTNKKGIAKLKGLGFEHATNIESDPNHKLNLEYFCILSYQRA